MAFDAARGQTVLFGGYNPTNPTCLNDTWVWDGTNWTRLHPVTSPPARAWFAMAYDAAHGQIVLFGGTNQSSFLHDTWVWDGTNWTRKRPKTSPQTSYSDFAMAYDAARGQVVLFGGFNQNTTKVLNDTWVWDGTNWTQQKPANSPAVRTGFAMAYDAANSQIVLFGGRRITSENTWLLNDTWVWDGTDWTRKSPATRPPARSGHAMAYDAANSQTVLFGGISGNHSTDQNDTWVWDGTNWTRQSPATRPAARDELTMAYFDDARSQVVLFGGASSGYLGDTWLWIAPPLKSQTITFASIPHQTEGKDLNLSPYASASSSLAVSFTSLKPSVCTVSGTVAHFVEEGTCSIRATQSGNDTYAPATPVTRNFLVYDQYRKNRSLAP